MVTGGRTEGALFQMQSSHRFVPCLAKAPVAYENSLLLLLNSLFSEIFSLLICIGNCSRSGCRTTASCDEIGSQSPRIAKFLVEFPVSREFARRRVRSALRRQPGISRFREFSSLVAESPANGGLF